MGLRVRSTLLRIWRSLMSADFPAVGASRSPVPSGPDSSASSSPEDMRMDCSSEVPLTVS